jgi:hypothetical protein
VVILNPGVMIDANNLTKYEARIGTGGGSGGTTLGMQTMDIGYHIRGMQNCINCSNGLPILNGAENDFFAQKNLVSSFCFSLSVANKWCCLPTIGGAY